MSAEKILALKQLDNNIQLQPSKVNLNNAGPEVGEYERSPGSLLQMSSISSLMLSGHVLAILGSAIQRTMFKSRASARVHPSFHVTESG